MLLFIIILFDLYRKYLSNIDSQKKVIAAIAGEAKGDSENVLQQLCHVWVDEYIHFPFLFYWTLLSSFSFILIKYPAVLCGRCAGQLASHFRRGNAFHENIWESNFEYSQNCEERAIYFSWHCYKKSSKGEEIHFVQRSSLERCVLFQFSVNPHLFYFSNYLTPSVLLFCFFFSPFSVAASFNT